jgi:hypothetical protein
MTNSLEGQITLKELGSVATASLRVVFFETGKRIAHRIDAKSSDVWQTWLTSCEGSDDEPWPTSPALQSLHIERHGADDIAFLVGMAGRSHWSASIRANQAMDRIEFEIACRANSMPLWLGSTYELLESTKYSLQINAAEPTVSAIENNKWTLTTALTDGPTPRTIAWGYTAAVR